MSRLTDEWPDDSTEAEMLPLPDDIINGVVGDDLVRIDISTSLTVQREITIDVSSFETSQKAFTLMLKAMRGEKLRVRSFLV